MNVDRSRSALVGLKAPREAAEARRRRMRAIRVLIAFAKRFIAYPHANGPMRLTTSHEERRMRLLRFRFHEHFEADVLKSYDAFRHVR